MVSEVVKASGVIIGHLKNVEVSVINAEENNNEYAFLAARSNAAANFAYAC